MGDLVTQVENVLEGHDETLLSARGRLQKLPTVEVDLVGNSWPLTEWTDWDSVWHASWTAWMWLGQACRKPGLL